MSHFEAVKGNSNVLNSGGNRDKATDCFQKTKEGKKKTKPKRDTQYFRDTTHTMHLNTMF